MIVIGFAELDTPILQGMAGLVPRNDALDSALIFPRPTIEFRMLPEEVTVAEVPTVKV
jgi:hypothetical protein